MKKKEVATLGKKLKGFPLKSLRSKFAVVYILMTLVVLLLLNVYPVLIYQDLVFDAKENSLLQDQALVISSALAGPEAVTQEKIYDAIALLGSTDGTRRIMVTDTSGLILYDSSTINHSEGQYALLQEVVLALQGNNVFRSNYTNGAFVSRAAVPVQYRSLTLGAVYVYEYDGEQGEILMGIQTNLQSISIMVFFTALIMSWLFSRTITSRVKTLLVGVTSVREGEYDTSIPVSGGDELTQLAEEFNALTDRLRTTEEVRRRFVSDASHELKTPLASICLLTDSILQTDNIDPEIAKEFMVDIGEEAVRLTRITERLLALTRMDATAVKEVHVVRMAPIVERAAHMLELVAEQAQVTIHLDISPLATVAANEDDLYQIAFNLVENAIKYNHPEGDVWVSLDEEEWVTLKVSDTGVGIPEDELDKIFQRFYRVDKARSREAGGTGLGLSIVRDTVLRHSGRVTAQRGEHGGALFTVTLPNARTAHKDTWMDEEWGVFRRD